MAEQEEVPKPVEGAEGEPPKKQRGKPKDPLQPPKPKNGYQQFTEKRRPQLKEEKPELASDLSAFGKQMAEDWLGVPQEEKDKLMEGYVEAMKIWKPKFAAYKATPGYKVFFEIKSDWMDIRARKKLGKKMNTGAPKRPASGYMRFANTIRDAVKAVCAEKGLGMGDQARMMSEQWQELTEAQKAEFGEQSQKEKVVWEVEYLKYKKSEDYKTFIVAKQKLEAGQDLKKLQRTHFDEAPKKASSAYALYRATIMPDIVKENEEKAEGEKMTLGQIGKRASGMWTELAEEKKSGFYSEAEKLKEQYAEDMKEFKTKQKYTNFLEKRAKVKLLENTKVNLYDLPKRPKSVFALFADEHKNEVPKGKGEGKGRDALKRKWTDAGDDTKKEYETREQQAKREWVEAVSEFKQGESYQLFEKTKKKIDLEFANEAVKVTTMRFLEAAPEPPPKTPFSLFLHDKRKKDPSSAKKSRKAKNDEVVAAKGEWLKLDKTMRDEYEMKRKDCVKEFEKETKGFMEGDTWKDYVKEAKRLKIPVRSLLFNKKQVLKKLGEPLGPSSIPLPSRPDTWPDKPKTAVSIFTKEKRDGGLDIPQINEMWKTLEGDEKGKYDDMALEQLKEYQAAMSSFKSSDEGKSYFRDTKSAQRRRTMLGAKLKFLKEQPKKPNGALMDYMKAAAAQVKKEHGAPLKGFELKKKLEDKWKSLSEDERQPYVEAAHKKFEEYEQAMKDFKASDNWTGFIRATKVKTMKKAGAKGKAKAKSKGPPMPRAPADMPKKPMNAFQSFCQEMARDGKSMPLAGLHKAYSELPEDEKKEKMDAANTAAEEFHTATATWEASVEGKKYKRTIESLGKRKKLADAKAKFMKDEPKRPPSAYFAFIADNRARILGENPELKGLGDQQKKLAQEWSALSEDGRKAIQDQLDEKTKEYEEQMIEFKKTPGFKRYQAILNGVMGKKMGKPGKEKMVPKGPVAPENLPKRPPHGMQLFGRTVQGNLKAQAEGWRALGAEGQKEWMEKSQELEREYSKQLVEFNRSVEGKKYNREKAFFDKKQRVDKAKERFLGKADAPKEPKRPPGSYFIFVQEKRSQVQATMPGAKIGDVARKLTEEWNKLEGDDKKEFDDKAATLKAEYEEEMATFRSSANYKNFQKAMSNITGVKAKKTAAKAKAKAKGKAGAKKDAASSDSDVMGSDSGSSSSSDSDSD